MIIEAQVLNIQLCADLSENGTGTEGLARDEQQCKGKNSQSVNQRTNLSQPKICHQLCCTGSLFKHMTNDTAIHRAGITQVPQSQLLPVLSHAPGNVMDSAAEHHELKVCL